MALLVTSIFLFAIVAITFWQASDAQAAGGLTVEIVTGYNLVVDSNVSSPSTYAPSVATVMGRFCNNTSPAATLYGVVGYIGDYQGGTGDTPGIYPARSVTDAGFTTEHPALNNPGSYSFTHVGGQLGINDAARYIGTLQPGECRVEYWHFSYPQCENTTAGARDLPPCDSGDSPVWGDSVKPGDDLYLDFDIWAKDASGSAYDNATWRMTMRNEISAMANKIEPNPDGEWFNLEEGTVQPGDVITSNGIRYEFGRINQGFDNDDNYTPDYNAWAQPIGDPSYDPSCFRLIRTTGVLTVTRSAGNPNLVVPFVDQLYFTNLPDDNTGVRGDVRYTFLALNGPCSTALSPYQEVASGYDNEKFNGDYGTALPPIESEAPQVNIDKTGNATVARPGTITYQIPFQNLSSTTSAGMTLSSGYGVSMPLVISDTVPDGLNYVGASAVYTLTYTPNNGVMRLYSTNSGQTWSTTDPGTTLSTWPNSKVIIQWWLNDPLPPNSSGNLVRYRAAVPSGYTQPFVENCADSSFGAGVPFDRACATTLIEGTGSIGDRVWQDENGDGNQTGELGISGIKVDLYYDKNGDGKLGSGDIFLKTTDTSGTGTSNYLFSSLPAGNYLVQVDANDPQLPTGYSLTTTGLYAVALADGQNYTTADFGFGPTLRLDKHLDTPDPAVVGETVTFHIDLINTRPGDGTANGYCVYYVWPNVTTTDSNANKQFTNYAYATGAPNLTYATADFSTGAGQWIAGSTFSSGGRTSGISRVEAVVNMFVLKQLVDDELQASMSGGASAWSYNFLPATINNYAPGEGKKGYMAMDIPGIYAPGGSWDWTDFNTALQLRLDMVKRTSPERTAAVMNVDAFGFRVTTSDMSCGGADSTINPLPLTDTYDSSKLQFLSADPMPTNYSTPGTLTWSNLGPLYAGGIRTVTLNFKALATTTSATIDTASVTEAKYSSGRDLNDASDTASVNINASFSLSGKTWIDVNNSGWPYQSGTDQALPNVKVDLYVCTDPATGLRVAQDTNNNQTCEANGFTWKLVGTKYTNAAGDYTFEGLGPGYYSVQANGKTIPVGMTQRTGEASGSANGTGIGTGGNCTTCDGEWNERTLAIKSMSYSTANVTQVNFGYNNPTLGTVTGFVWQDQDQGGYNDWDATEPPIPGATVTLICEGTGCGSPSYTTTTDQNGYYQFSNLNVGANAVYHVVITPPSGMGQTADPNYAAGSCYGTGNCDNQTNTFTLAAGGSHGPDLFGYYGGLSLSGTVFTDWNASGGHPESGEEGITSVPVYLYRDLDGDGVLDPGEPMVSSTTTDASGNYQFNNLVGNGTKYLVVVNQAAVPSGYQQTADYDVTTGACSGTQCDNDASVTLNNTSVTQVDTGYQPRGYATIGDTVWSDADADGVLDAGESGIGGVAVKLYQDQDGDGVLDPEDALVKSRTTLNYTVIDGYIDISGNGSIGTDDDYTTGLMGVNVIDGGLDINGDGAINGNDDGTFVGYTVIDGRLDMNDSGGVTISDDGSLAGRYQFINLAAGNYIVQVDSANFGSGQPLNGLTLTNSGTAYNTGQVSYKVALGATDKIWTADFGFASSAVGDTVWQDNNGNGLQDAGEPGIPNVSVELWRDTNNDGTGDTLVSTKTTDANGNYYFTGLPAGDYVVVIPSTNWDQSGDPLYNFTQTYDPDAPSGPCGGYCDNQGMLVDTTSGYGLPLGQNDYSIDFGYQPRGTIGDTLWINPNGNSTREAGESGIANVTVWLCTSSPCTSGNAVQTTSTDANGYYSFGNLPDGTYYVAADTTDPDFPGGLTPNYNPDGNLNSEVSQIILSGGVVTSIGGNSCTSCNMNADIGYIYVGNNSISGEIFYDPNDNATQDAGEDDTYAGVTVYLYRGGLLIGTTTTDANGHYSFGGLPDGNYAVSYNPNAPVLNGLQPTVTSSPTTFLLVPLDPGGTNPNPVDETDQDFGLLSTMDFGDLPSNYLMTLLANDGARHIVPATGAVYLGTAAPDTEWNGQPSSNATGDGADETPPPPGTNTGGVVRTGNWAPGSTGGSIDVTVGGCSPAACYLSGWIDWNNDGDFGDPGERILTGRKVVDGTTGLTFAIPTGTSFSNVTYYARFRLYDTYDALVTTPTGLAPNGEVEDYGWYWSPTGIDLVSFTARAHGQAILLTWETANEFDNLGFNLYRAESLDGPQSQITDGFIPSQGPGSPTGFVYTFLDETASPGVTYYYWLEDVNIYGAASRHGPETAFIRPVAPFSIYLPSVVK